MTNCRNCARTIKRGQWCSAIECHTKGQQQAEVDARALARNTRHLASLASRELLREPDHASVE